MPQKTSVPTEQPQTEQQPVRAQADLDRRVQERAAELRG
jgi:hypothetical protein